MWFTRKNNGFDEGIFKEMGDTYHRDTYSTKTSIVSGLGLPVNLRNGCHKHEGKKSCMITSPGQNH